MFTGIVEATGKLIAQKDNKFVFENSFQEAFKKGESVSLSGMCATVINSNDQQFEVEIMGESRSKTIFGNINLGEAINLERAAVIGQRNSGHHVTGHIDELGEIIDRRTQDDYEIFRIGFSEDNKNLVVPKGCIAIDGISLTISDFSESRGALRCAPTQCRWFEIAIISHTLENTTLGNKKPGDKVHLEFDLFGKYVIYSAR